MTFINTILETENSAEQAITQAKETADVAFTNAENKVKEDFKNLDEKLKSERVKALAEQKPTLMENYKRILNVGTTRANEIDSSSARNKEKAFSHILNNLA